MRSTAITVLPTNFRGVQPAGLSVADASKLLLTQLKRFKSDKAGGLIPSAVAKALIPGFTDGYSAFIKSDLLHIQILDPSDNLIQRTRTIQIIDLIPDKGKKSNIVVMLPKLNPLRVLKLPRTKKETELSKLPAKDREPGRLRLMLDGISDLLDRWGRKAGF